MLSELPPGSIFKLPQQTAIASTKQPFVRLSMHGSRMHVAIIFFAITVFCYTKQ